MAKFVLNYAGQKFTVTAKYAKDVLEGFDGDRGLCEVKTDSGHVTFVVGPGIPVYVAEQKPSTLQAF